MDLENGHNIVRPDGYDRGRDEVVGNATAGSSARGYTFAATTRNITGLLQRTPSFPLSVGLAYARVIAGSQNINHGLSIDGIVMELTVQITNRTGLAAKQASSARYVATSFIAYMRLMALSRPSSTTTSSLISILSLATITSILL